METFGYSQNMASCVAKIFLSAVAADSHTLLMWFSLYHPTEPKNIKSTRYFKKYNFDIFLIHTRKIVPLIAT